ncbi:O-antigen ligase family protein [Cryobacterium sp. 1639]|uniref:O-antigen ligase family protein n=1 Tax=Cryobacterium inferilacus TaxID=2866629 RepID=UPI001C736D65|nr:O-antigen ligase family protein [Cryobacterium sp. 1639]MBX0300977.1 O-antigen ligase family protein [Cryobacterium sp. 1639]
MIQLVLPLAIFAGSVVVLYRVPRDWASWTGVISAIVMAVLVPSFSTSAPAAVVTIMSTVVMLVLALWRDRGVLAGLNVPLVLLIFIGYSSVFGAAQAPIALVLQYLATGALLMLLSLAVVGAVVRRGLSPLLPTFGIVLVFQFVISFGEEFLGTKAVWPRADGTDNITHRVNAFLPSVIGRAMGSTAHPIPLGMLFGFCVVVCLWFALRRRSLFYLALGVLGIVGMALSGTRSAFVSLAGALLFWLVSAFWRKKAVLIPLIAALVIGVPAAIFFVFANLGSGVRNSSSFVHRIGILDTASNLFKRDPLEVLFGTGFSSIVGLIEDGVIQGVDGIGVVDQEFVRTLAGTGVIGLLLMLAVIVLGLIRGSKLPSLLVVFVVVGFAAFDSLSWRLIFTLFVVAVASVYGVGAARRNNRESHTGLRTEDEQKRRRPGGTKVTSVPPA